MYDSRFRANLVTAVGAWIKWCAHWCGRYAALRVDSVTVLVDMRFIRCTEELSYGTRLVTFMARYTKLPDLEAATHSLGYVALLFLFELHHLLISFEYWLKETIFERRFRLTSTGPHFVK